MRAWELREIAGCDRGDMKRPDGEAGSNLEPGEVLNLVVVVDCGLSRFRERGAAGARFCGARVEARRFVIL